MQLRNFRAPVLALNDPHDIKTHLVGFYINVNSVGCTDATHDMVSCCLEPKAETKLSNLFLILLPGYSHILLLRLLREQASAAHRSALGARRNRAAKVQNTRFYNLP
jgi:hypothetical protein